MIILAEIDHLERLHVLVGLVNRLSGEKVDVNEVNHPLRLQIHDANVRQV